MMWPNQIYRLVSTWILLYIKDKINNERKQGFKSVENVQ